MNHTQNKSAKPMPIVSTRPPIQRTLIITIGTEAETAYSLFAQRIQEQQGPTAALAYLNYAANNTTFTTSVKDALKAEH